MVWWFEWFLFFKMTLHLLIVVKRKINHFLKFNGNSPIKAMEWPSSSPDLNPIENIWNTLKQTMNNKRPTNVMELLQAGKNFFRCMSEICRLNGTSFTIINSGQRGRHQVLILFISYILFRRCSSSIFIII